MCVPPGAFGGTTPERKASELLAAMMTHIACWIVIDQTETTAPRISVREDGARGSDDDASSTSSERRARRAPGHERARLFARLPPPQPRPRRGRVRHRARRGEPRGGAARPRGPRGVRRGRFRVGQRAKARARRHARVERRRAIRVPRANPRRQRRRRGPGTRRRRPAATSRRKKRKDARDDETKEVTAARRRTLAALRSDWARTRGRTRAFLGVFDGASPPLADRATWVMKSLAGFVEYGDAEDMESERRSLAKLGGTLRGAGVEAGEVRRTVGERRRGANARRARRRGGGERVGRRREREVGLGRESLRRRRRGGPGEGPGRVEGRSERGDERGGEKRYIGWMRASGSRRGRRKLFFFRRRSLQMPKSNKRKTVVASATALFSLAPSRYFLTCATARRTRG